MKRKLAIALSASLVGLCQAQWQVPTSLVLDGPGAEDRQVKGVGAPEGADHGASAATDRNSGINFAAATGANDLIVSLSPAPAAYVAGLRITIVPSAANSGAASVNVNGLGPVPLRKNINVPLDSGDLHAGIPIQLIHDGAVFQVAGQIHPGCPTGYLPVGTSSCVEQTSHDAVNWYSAVSACTAQGKRLCGFAEWIQACRQTDNIFGSIMDYEWVDEAANSVNDAKTMGINATTLLPDCLSGGTRGPLELMRYRCCYDR